MKKTKPMSKTALKRAVATINKVEQVLAGQPLKVRTNRKTLYYLVRDKQGDAGYIRFSVKASDVKDGANKVIDFVVECAQRGQKFNMTTQRALRQGFNVLPIKQPKRFESIEALRHQLDTTGKIDAYAD